MPPFRPGQSGNSLGRPSKGRRKKIVPRGGLQNYYREASRGCCEVDICRSLRLSYDSWVRIKDEDPRALDAFSAYSRILRTG